MTFGSGFRLLVLTAGATLIVGCGAREQSAATIRIQPIAWESCGAVDCADFRVPLDQFAPAFGGSALVRLRAYRQISDAVGSRHLPLVIHPGGPGADVRDAVEGARSALAPIIDDFDIYALSTRGTIDGTAFDCGMSLDDLRTVDIDTAAAHRFASACRMLSADLVGRVGTRDSVADLETFRRSLGFDRVRFLGWSYGATLGAAWAMSHPSSIRSMVLDAPSDLRGQWADELALRYSVASQVFERNRISAAVDGAGNARERALAREYLLYDPAVTASADKLVALRLGETPDGTNDGGIETQIGVHCSDVTSDQARRAVAIAEPTPRIGFGATFDRICVELGGAVHPLEGLHVDYRATRVEAMVVATMGDHVIPPVASVALAKAMRWRLVTIDALRHLSVGFDPVATKKAMAFLDVGD